MERPRRLEALDGTRGSRWSDGQPAPALACGKGTSGSEARPAPYPPWPPDRPERVSYAAARLHP